MPLLFQPKEKIVCIGDSVTDAERAKPIGEGLFGALGKGWVTQVDALLSVTYPAHQVRLVNMGTSGNQVTHLAQRWQTDVLDLKPDHVVVMIGINDVWRQFDLPRQPEQHVLPKAYEATLDKLVAKTLPTVKSLILMTPFIIESSPADAMRARMDEYGTIVQKIATKRKTRFIDTQAAFNRVLEHQHSSSIAWDRIHPNQVGHMVIARAFLQAVGFEWSGGE